MPIAHYFVFPEFNVAVARGDVLWFNPRYFHRLSQKTADYTDGNVFVTS